LRPYSCPWVGPACCFSVDAHDCLGRHKKVVNANILWPLARNADLMRSVTGTGPPLVVEALRLAHNALGEITGACSTGG